MMPDEFAFPPRLTEYHRNNLPAQYPSCQTWLSQSGYCQPPELVPSQTPLANVFYLPEVPLYAPVPLPSYPPLLSCPDPHDPRSYVTMAPERISRTSSPQVSFSPPSGSTSGPDPGCQTQQQGILDVYVNAPQLTFPTPSELLTELTARDTAATQVRVEPEPEKKNETQRKARQRAVAESIGFQPTDPWV